VHIGLHHHRQHGPVDAAARLQQRGEERSLPQLGDLELDIAGLGRQQPGAAAVAVGGPGGCALVAPSTDLLGGFGLDQRLEHQRQAFTDHIKIAASAQCIQQLRQGRLIEGHRGELLGVNPGRNTLSFTRWPSPCYSAGKGPALKPHHVLGHLRRDRRSRHRPREGLARDLPETVLRAASLRPTTQPQTVPLTCAVVWLREVLRGEVNSPSINGMQGVRGSIPLSFERGLRLC
jgi:hypothetical protein